MDAWNQMKGKIGNEQITVNDVFKGYLSKELGKWETSDDPECVMDWKQDFKWGWEENKADIDRWNQDMQ